MERQRALHPQLGPAARGLDPALQEIGTRSSSRLREHTSPSMSGGSPRRSCRKRSKQSPSETGSTGVTNVVKHFKWEPRGGRRLHRTPNRSEISACMPWLEAEIEVIEPEVVVTLGATASKALLGTGFRVTRQRGRLLESELGPPVAATVHPAAVLRRPDAEERRAERRRMVEDLRTVARHLANGGA